MMYERTCHNSNLNNYSFLVTGGAGFIGSNLVEYLLKYGAAKVRVLDNFSTGSRNNIKDFKSNPSFELIDGDIRDLEVCKKAVSGIDFEISLNQLWAEIMNLKDLSIEPIYGETRAGDVRHSLADITKAQTLLGYQPLTDFKAGIKITVDYWNV